MAAFSSMVQHQNSNQPNSRTPSTQPPDMSHLYHYLQNENNCRNSNPLAFQHQILAATAQQIQPGFMFPSRLPFNLNPPFPNFSPGFNLEEEEDGIEDNIQVELENKHLWDMFSNCVNEMIITKSGRLIFFSFLIS